jgi:hypothetical protein
MTDPAAPDSELDGPATSEPPTDWPEIDHHGPEHEAEEHDRHHVPTDLLELHEVLEYAAALEAEETAP